MRIFALILLITAAMDGYAWVGVLDLKRVIVFGASIGNEVVIDEDTHVFGGVPRGTLTLEVNDNTLENVAMRFDAAIDDEALLERRGIAIGYAATGGRYEFYDAVQGEIFYVYFMRRELSEDSYDPAVLFVVEIDDGRQAWLDYRHSRQ